MKSRRLWLYSLIAFFIPESRCYKIKNFLLRLCGIKIGKNVRIYSSTVFHGCGDIEIGDDVFIGPKCIFSCGQNAILKIGKYVNIGAMNYITTGTHLIDPKGERTCGDGFHRNVTIEDGAWLTVHICVLPGVMTPELKIGTKTMIMAGTVITSSIQPRVIMLGNPARKIGEL